MIFSTSRKSSNRLAEPEKTRDPLMGKVVKIVFSPTGGTAAVAEGLGTHLGEYVREIDLTDAHADFSRERVAEDEVAVIAAPSYGGRIPRLAAQRLEQVRADGARAVVVSVYGNRDL